jgi:hypothetical protein
VNKDGLCSEERRIGRKGKLVDVKRLDEVRRDYTILDLRTREEVMAGGRLRY